MCIGIFKSMLGICETKPLSTDLWKLEDGKIQIKLGEGTNLINEGDAVYLKGAGLPNPVLIVRDEGDKYLAFANKCTHGKRKLDPVHGERVLRCCSVGHSTFDYDGNVIKGRAKNPIIKYDVEVSGDSLTVIL